MTVARKGETMGVLLNVTDESKAPETIHFRTRIGDIHSDLTIGAAVVDAQSLKANNKIASNGCALNGAGFILDRETADALCTGTDALGLVVKPYRNGRDLMAKPRKVFVIDLFGYADSEVLQRWPAIYQHVALNVRPDREARAGRTPNATRYAKNWWIYQEPRTVLRSALRGLCRYIATVETTKHRVFQFLDYTILPDHMLIAVASDDAQVLGVLSSRIHVVWALASGARLGVGDDPRYSKSRCFDPFPFPADVPEQLKALIRTEAEGLDSLRKRVLAEHVDLTLTKLYNVLEALREGRALTEAERDIHDRGLVTLIRQRHDAIDSLVAKAYGWPADLSDEDILARLVVLNKQRAAEEAKGLIRWLRPEYQAPEYKAPVTQTLDFGETATAVPDNIIAWPNALPEQVSAVQQVLAAASAPLAPQDVARAFKGKRAATVRPVLEALAGIGMARRLEDGRYAA